MYWFTSDLHFDHAKIIEHTHRPFTTVEAMNSHLIRVWNEWVGPGDVVVVAGDVTLNSDPEYVRYAFLRYLHGNLIFLKGNHDYWIKGAANIRYLYHKKIDDQKVAVSHYPMRSWKASRYGGFNLHGHTHAMLKPWKNQLDIGVDNAKILLGEYRPFNMNEVKEIIGRQNETSQNLWDSEYRSKSIRSILLRTFTRLLYPRGIDA
jgi:calcineurin-like phosphoesterase family protein